MDLKVCRICGGVEQLKNILHQDSKMVDKLFLCANVKIYPGDLLPKLICEQCDKNLDISYQFRKQSEATQKRLNHKIKIQQNEQIDDTKYKDELELSSDISFNVSNRECHYDIGSCKQIDEPQQSSNNLDRIMAVENVSKLKDVVDCEQTYCISLTEEKDVNIMKTTYDVPMEKSEPECILIENDVIGYVNSNDNNDQIETRFSWKEEKDMLQKHVTDEILIDDKDFDDEIFYANSDLNTNTREKNYDKEELKKTTELPITFEHCSIELLSTSSESEMSDCCDDFENEQNDADVKALTCGTCHEIFTKKKEYSVHIKQHGDERYQCIQCCKFFPTRSRLKRHEEIHNDIPSYQCFYCKRSYRAPYNLKRHIKSAHIGEKNLECNLCNLSFSRVDVLKRHLQLHSDEKNYKCSLCSKSFKTRDYLYAHNKSHHNPNLEISQSNKRTKTDKINNQCNYCGKMFKSLFAYKNHLLIHTNQKPYECESCKKKFRTIAALTTHQRIHDGFRPYQCEFCLKSFRQMAHLKEHKFLHLDNVAQHVCSICQVLFAKKSNLKAHMRTHSKEKPFKCADCSAEFSYLHLLQRHASKVHKRSVHKVYTINDIDETLEPEDTDHSNVTLGSEPYHYIDTVADDDFDHNDADVDLISDNDEVYTSFPELEMISENPPVEQHISDVGNCVHGNGSSIGYIQTFNSIQSETAEEDFVVVNLNDDDNVTEQKVDLFVSEETKLISSAYNVNK